MKCVYILLAMVLGGCVGAAPTPAADGVVWIAPSESMFDVGQPITIGNDSAEYVDCEVETNGTLSTRELSPGEDWTITIHGPNTPMWMVVDCGDDGFWRMSAR